MMDHDKFTERFRLLMREHHYEHKKYVLARRLGYKSSSVMTIWMTTTQWPTIKTLDMIADMWGVSVDWLIGRTDER